MTTSAILYHVHDPMCSWCWGYRRSWDQLRATLPDSIKTINVVGGLAPDSNEPMPLEQQSTIAGYWKNVEQQTGAQFNHDFWKKCTPRRSTYPACRAVLTAATQGAEQSMIEAIQSAYYLRAMNPSDDSTLIALATELKLDEKKFADELNSPKTRGELQRNFELRRSIGVYSFPSLVLVQNAIQTPIEVDYQSHQPSLKAIISQLSPT
jgi:putative protein-disulfide isomerase